MPTRKPKRTMEEINELIAQVDDLVNHPNPRKRMSVRAACEKVGLQTTVYYFRKRKEKALEEKLPAKAPSKPAPKTRTADLHDYGHKEYSNKDATSLVAEIKDLEERIRQAKNQLVQAMLNDH